MNQIELKKVIHDMIGQYLTKNEVGFKEEIITKVLKDNPRLDRDVVFDIYDVEYKWWSDAYCD